MFIHLFTLHHSSYFLLLLLKRTYVVWFIAVFVVLSIIIIIWWVMINKLTHDSRSPNRCSESNIVKTFVDNEISILVVKYVPNENVIGVNKQTIELSNRIKQCFAHWFEYNTKGNTVTDFFNAFCSDFPFKKYTKTYYVSEFCLCIFLWNTNRTVICVRKFGVIYWTCSNNEKNSYWF